MGNYEENVEQQFTIPIKWKIIFFTVIILGVFVIPKIINNNGGNQVKSCAETVVSNMLRAPSTAIFSEEKIVEKDSYGRYIVTMYVESENAFGGNIRKFAIVVLQKVNGDGTFSYLTGNSAQLISPDSLFLKDSIISNLKAANSWDEPRN